MTDTGSREIILTGINVSPGICIGKAYLVDIEGVDVVKKYFISEDDVQDEIKRFKSAVNKAKQQMLTIITNAPEELRDHTYILETHKTLLKDKMLYGRTIETIKNEKVNAEWALKKVVSDVKSMFKNMSDSYLKERATDIVYVSDRIMRNLVGAESEKIADIDKRVILVANDLSPAEASQINLERIKGFVTDRGGKTSHTSIIARTLEIPAVMGLGNATNIIKNDNLIIIDGTVGTVIIHPTEETLLEYGVRSAKYEELKAAITRDSYLQAETADGFQLKVMGNIELPEEVVSVIDYGGDGIGLYRTEFQYLSSPILPKEYELFDKYKDVVEVIAPKPVTIRTLDINGDKAFSNNPDYMEANPALGLRAIRYCLKNPDVFRTQLRAILRAAAFGNVRILIPMISSYEEVLETKRILDEVADALDKEGTLFNRNVELGIMIEVPSAVIIADILAGEVDFFSLGTNDLIQYSLAIDRGNRNVAHLYHSLHPAIIRMIKQLADVARNKGIKLFMCGEMASDPINLPILLGLGIDELSMNPQSIPAVKSMIRALKVEDARAFMKDVFKQNTASGVEELIRETYGSILFEKVYARRKAFGDRAQKNYYRKQKGQT
ncbi:MAG: phosphoenolpyruvate--protein phosphotransferase [Deltaproteobacteria bacterium]|jgi:phosphotransferase system enzyme I (PtsI)|nr:phosphoenolpyruvate--protein phosphotransferase [Deltaproteobacteria bacterium]